MDLMEDELEPNPEWRAITNEIIGAAIAVHRELGPGFPEAVYQRALAIEFGVRGMQFVEQYSFNLTYHGQSVGSGKLDFLVDQQIVVELKSVESIAAVHRAQLLAYLKATGFRLGILINFNEKLLKDGIRRIVF